MRLPNVTNGRTTHMYKFAGGSVAYFAPDAPAFQEAAELNQVYLATAQQVLRVG